AENPTFSTESAKSCHSNLSRKGGLTQLWLDCFLYFACLNVPFTISSCEMNSCEAEEMAKAMNSSSSNSRAFIEPCTNRNFGYAPIPAP
ncbi:hypothetical protein, partial [Pseudomonas frederiksbergensis]|uniref:hypothetical protein n=1 Tax=Pseudomonas frederiksbergensis TaxID=104087 RepID=UPI001981C49D